MIVDSSAIVALVLREPGWEDLAEHIAGASSVGVGAPTLTETEIVLASRLGDRARTLLARLMGEAGVATIPFGADHVRAAASAYLAYGRGRHPAALNFGGCVSYAVAKLAGSPLLCVGDGFTRTDLEILTPR